MADLNKRELVKKSTDTPRWYTDVIQLAELADYGPARGTMVIRPYGYAIWERVQKEFDKAVKRLGAKNAYFPLFIPMSLLQKEKAHVEGFAPELAVVTHGGGKKLAEPLAVRPTSETVMYEMYSKWISSWRDLPLKINQWNNVVRWEKRTYFFLRTSEFLWQEGHTAHADYADAEDTALEALGEYEQLYKDIFAIPVIAGLKSEAEKFAGADHTYSVELLMSDGKILQGATSHHLGDNFSKGFDITYQDKEGNTKYVFQTSWGLSTRSIGGLILVHGDDDGLVLPPKLAPVKLVIIPILGKSDSELMKYCDKVKSEVGKNKSAFYGEVEIWDYKEHSYGRKLNDFEIKGIPLAIVIGDKEMKDKKVTLKYRLKGEKDESVSLDLVGHKVEEVLKEIQQKMFDNAKKHLEENTNEAGDYDEFKKIMKEGRGFIKTYWCENPDCEAKIKEETKATTRVRGDKKSGSCVYCARKARYTWYFGQAY